MKSLLIGINSKFTHTSLSVRTLSANSNGTEFCEFTINENVLDVAANIYAKQPDVLCFSCYIWNIEYVLKLASTLKKMLPDSIIIFGGPEVSYSAADTLEKYPFVNAVIRGEGEETFKELTENNFAFANVKGITYRNDEIIQNPHREQVQNLDSLQFPYTKEDLLKNKGKLIYYESSRGCPFGCSYCLSSAERGVRFKSIEQVKEELQFLIDSKPATIKFVDRTFNADPGRSIELIKFMIDRGEGTTFHFEIEAHSISDEFLELVRSAPKGMFRFEIGIQSTNPDTLRAINRNPDVEKLLANIKKIISLDNVHVHLDLIAGLPFETYDTFKNSFNNVMSLEPDVMQLGFLKLLKGTKILREKEIFSYKCTDFPPYEIISNEFITCKEIIKLKKIEFLVDKYFNSGAFGNSLKYMKSKFGDYMSLFESLSLYFEEKGYFNLNHSRDGLYSIFAEFGKEDTLFLNLLKFDYFTNTKNASTPVWSAEAYNMEVHKKRAEIIEENRNTIFSDRPVRDILKNVHFEEFSWDLENKKQEKWIGVFAKSGRFLGKINNNWEDNRE